MRKINKSKPKKIPFLLKNFSYSPRTNTINWHYILDNVPCSETLVGWHIPEKIKDRPELIDKLFTDVLLLINTELFARYRGLLEIPGIVHDVAPKTYEQILIETFARLFTFISYQKDMVK